MSSNISRRRPPLDDDPSDDAELPPEEELLEPDEPVEYFVEVELELSSVLTSVPKSVQLSQTSSSAPSILTRFGLEVSVPHISH
jgi:hypothetical protein